MLQDILLAIPIGIFLAFMIGPVFFVLIETALIKGTKAALFFDVGVIVGDISFIFLAYLGTNRFLEKLQDNPYLYVAGSIILSTYGCISYLQKNKTEEIPAEFKAQKLKKKAITSLAVKGFLLNFINIGVLGFWLGLLIVAGPKLNMETNRLVVFFGSVILAYFLTDVVKILIAKKLKSKLTPQNIAQAKKTTAVIIITFGLILFVKAILFFNNIDTGGYDFEKFF